MMRHMLLGFRKPQKSWKEHRRAQCHLLGERSWRRPEVVLPDDVRSMNDWFKRARLKEKRS